jgi:hypothetical protein
MWHLEKLNITDIVKEIENNHFILIQKAKKHIIQTHGRWQDSLKKTVGDNIF